MPDGMQAILVTLLWFAATGGVAVPSVAEKAHEKVYQPFHGSCIEHRKMLSPSQTLERVACSTTCGSNAQLIAVSAAHKSFDYVLDNM